jgi:hypothetical protein
MRQLGQSRRRMPYVADGLYSSFSASNDGSVMALVAATAYVNLHSAEIRRNPAAMVCAVTTAT